MHLKVNSGSKLQKQPFEFCPVAVPETQKDLCADIGIGKDWYVNNGCGPGDGVLNFHFGIGVLPEGTQMGALKTVRYEK